MICACVTVMFVKCSFCMDYIVGHQNICKNSEIKLVLCVILQAVQFKDSLSINIHEVTNL